MFSFEVCVTAAVALAAVISPVLTALINNRHQLKLRSLEIAEKRRRDDLAYRRSVYEKYLCCAGKYAKGCSCDDFSAYGEAFALAYAYSSDNLRFYMEELDEAMDAPDTDKISILLPRVSALVAEAMYKPIDGV